MLLGMSPSISRRMSVPVLVFVASFVGCGGEETATPSSAGAPTAGDSIISAADVPADLARLVPAESPAVVYLAEPQKMLDEVRAIAKRMQPGSEGAVNLDTVIGPLGLGFRTRDLDLSKPMALVLGPNGPRQLVVGAKDAAELSDLAEGDTATSGSFVAIGMPAFGPESDSTPPAAGEPAKLMQGLPDSSVAIHVDLTAFRQYVDMGEQMFRQMMAREPGGEMVLEVYAPVFEFAKRDGAIDLFFDLDGGKVGIGGVAEFEGAAGGEVSEPTCEEILGRLPSVGDGAIVIAFGPIMSQMASWFDMEKMFESAFSNTSGDVPPDFQESMKAYMAAVQEVYAKLDGAGAGSMTFGPDGMKGAFAMSGSDVPGALQASRGMMERLAGFGFVKDVETKKIDVAGSEFDFASGAWDLDGFAERFGMPQSPSGPDTDAMMKALYGERMQGGFGELEGLVVGGIGYSEDELAAVAAQVKKTDHSHGEASRALAAIPGRETLMFMHFDFFAMMRQMKDFMPPMPGGGPEIPAGVKAPIMLSVSRTGAKYRFDLGFDLFAFAELGR